MDFCGGESVNSGGIRRNFECLTILMELLDLRNRFYVKFSEK